MRKICLDKTINLTRSVMNREVQIPEYLQITTELGSMDRFNFVNSKVELPIEHIGLAMLSYRSAVDQFAFTQVDESEEKTSSARQFESLIGTGTHISDFIETISPDTLNWYYNRNGMLKMQYRNGVVTHNDLNNYKQCKVSSEEGEDIRELTIREAYNQAMRDYVEAEIDEMGEETDYPLLESLHALVEEDVASFDAGMEALKAEATKLVIDSNQNQQVEIAPQNP